MKFVLFHHKQGFILSFLGRKGKSVRSLSTLLCKEMKRGKLSALPSNMDILFSGMDVPILIEF